MKQRHPKWFLCAIAALAGLGVLLIMPAYRFAGFFLLFLAALVPAYHFARAPFLRRVLTGFLAVLLVMLSITGGVIARSAHGTGSQHADYLIVLGCQVNGTVPSRMLRQRLDAALIYLNTYPDALCIVSGGMGSGEDITEANCMYSYLTAAGIDERRIIPEDRSTSTMENLRFSLELMETDSVAIVSNEFHLYRADQMAQSLGLKASLIPADTELPILLASYSLREIFAVWKFHFLGG